MPSIFARDAAFRRRGARDGDDVDARILAFLEARLSPSDLAECERMLGEREPGAEDDEAETERMHRPASGGPARPMRSAEDSLHAKFPGAALIKPDDGFMRQRVTQGLHRLAVDTADSLHAKFPGLSRIRNL